MLHAAAAGLALTLAWPNILIVAAATLAAMAFSFLPGVSAVTLSALVIPFTLSWDPLTVLLVFGPLVGGATYMGSVTAILLGVPGNPPNAATLIDGHALAREGRALTALGCSAAASALGSTFGVIVLILLLPVMREALLYIGPPEFLMLALLGLTTVTAVRSGGLFRGLAAAGAGLLLSFVGRDPRTGELRYTLGSLELWDGVSVVPALLGIFSVAGMLDLAVSGRRSIAGGAAGLQLAGSVREGVFAVFRNFGLFLRCSVLGSLVGMIPGTGGTVAGFVAYGHAVQSAGAGRVRFGQGEIRGVLAPEAAHDAKDGGSLVPTLAFGVPGNEGTALLLVALAVHGIAPGRELMTSGLSLVFVLIWSLFLSNWMTSLLGLALARPLARVTLVPTHRLAPLLLGFSVLCAYAYQGRFAHVVTALAFGAAGYLMKKHAWPRVSLVLGLVLGPLFEVNFHQTLQLHTLGRVPFWSRPIALALLGLTLLVLGWAAARSRAAGREGR